MILVNVTTAMGVVSIEVSTIAWYMKHYQKKVIRKNEVIFR